MSKSGQRPREWRFYVQDMIKFGEKVLSYTDGLGQNAFRRRQPYLRRYSAQSGAAW